MEIELNELLNAHRESYLHGFYQFLNDLKDRKGASEVLVNPQNGVAEIYNYCRLDFLEKKEDGSLGTLEYVPNGYLKHENISFHVEKKEIVVSPFIWDDCKIDLDIDVSDFTEINKWFLHWIDINDKIATSKTPPFIEFIHRMLKPTISEQGTTIQLDLGTAPVDSLLRLLEICVEHYDFTKLSVSMSRDRDS